MIKKILRISDFRVFQRWSPAVDAVDFARVNLLFGVNGSGKSTLASMLARASRDTAWSSGLRLTVEEPDGIVSTIEEADHKLWNSLRVFNREFVETNLLFDTDGGSSTKPLLILGEEQIDKRSRLQRLAARLSVIEDDLPAHRRASKKAQDDAESVAKRAADLVVQELGSLGGRYAPRNFNARELKKALSNPPSLVDRTQVASDLEIVQSPGLDQLAQIARLEFDSSQLELDVAALLARSVISLPIADLRDTPHVADWVQNGLVLHVDNSTCKFCGNELSIERRQALERHFDESLTQLQADVKAVDDSLQSAVSQAAAAAITLPTSKQIITGMRNEWSTELAVIVASEQRLQERLTFLREQLAVKSLSMFSTVEMTSNLPGDSRLDLAPLNAIIDKHNNFCADAGTLQLSAATRIEAVRVEDVRDEYETLLARSRQEATRAADLERERLKLLEEQTILSQTDMDATPLADSLNADLTRLLGRDDLSFDLVDSGYAIRRAKQPALFLSEGEKTAISLLYFLKSLDAHDCDITKTIVIIDDPVSSLDSNVVAGVSAHLWARLVGSPLHCQQVFLLTHSFELFRTWINLVDRAAPKVRDLTSTTQELRTRLVENEDGSIGRIPSIFSWPTTKPERDRMRSEYHYLFWRVASTLQECQANPNLENDLDAAAMLPNACRRMLEAFLSFKYPGKIGDFRGQVEAAIGSIDESVTRTRIVTFLNTHSHNEEGDIGRPLARPESVGVLAAVLDLIRIVDREHYESMCASLHVEPRTVTI